MHGVTESRPVTVRMEARPWRSGNKTTEWATKLALTRSAFSWKGPSTRRFRIAPQTRMTVRLPTASRIPRVLRPYGRLNTAQRSSNPSTSAWASGPAHNRGAKAVACDAQQASTQGVLLDRFAARREKARGRSDVDVRDEQPLFAVWLVAEQRPVGPHHRRSGRRPSTCEVHSCDKAGVLGGATQDRFQLRHLRRDLHARDHRMPALRQRQCRPPPKPRRRACNQNPLCHRSSPFRFYL